MLFLKRLRDPIREGRITQTVRMWMRPHVTVGHRYAMDDGQIEVDSIEPIAPEQVTDSLARACGFRDAVDMLGIAQHGAGRNLYLVRFHYVAEPASVRPRGGGSGSRNAARVGPRRGSRRS